MIFFLSTSISYFCPQTPPSTYRRQQVDIHYNSLPRANAPTTSTPIQSGCSSANNSPATINDSNANPKRNAVAFGKQLMNQYIPHSATKSASNICQQQMVLYQQPEPTSISPSMCHGFQKQKGVSVPNLGLPNTHTQNHFSFFFLLVSFTLLLFLLLFFLNFVFVVPHTYSHLACSIIANSIFFFFLLLLSKLCKLCVNLIPFYFCFEHVCMHRICLRYN